MGIHDGQDAERFAQEAIRSSIESREKAISLVVASEVLKVVHEQIDGKKGEFAKSAGRIVIELGDLRRAIDPRSEYISIEQLASTLNESADLVYEEAVRHVELADEALLSVQSEAGLVDDAAT